MRFRHYNSGAVINLFLLTLLLINTFDKTTDKDYEISEHMLLILISSFPLMLLQLLHSETFTH